MIERTKVSLIGAQGGSTNSGKAQYRAHIEAEIATAHNLSNAVRILRALGNIERNVEKKLYCINLSSIVSQYAQKLFTPDEKRVNIPHLNGTAGIIALTDTALIIEERAGAAHNPVEYTAAASVRRCAEVLLIYAGNKSGAFSQAIKAHADLTSALTIIEIKALNDKAYHNLSAFAQTKFESERYLEQIKMKYGSEDHSIFSPLRTEE